MALAEANETSALRGEPQQTSVAEDDYKSFSDALGANARGRAFLHEYAKRNRHSDTEVVLAALDRLESVARSQKIAPEAERIRQDLRALLETIHSARPQIDSTPGAIKAATLSALIEFVQARIEALVQPSHAPLASVPEPEQRELPIPQPGSTAQRTIALVEAIAPRPEPVSVASPEQQGFALTLDPRVAPAARNFDPDVLLSQPPRSTRIIPEVNFIDSLFDAIDAKSKAKSNAKNKTKAAKPPEQAVTGAPAVAVLPTEAPAITAAKLPIEMPGPVAAPVGAQNVETAPVAEMAIVSAAPAASNDGGNADVAGAAENITRAPANATAAAINASAAAIDEIVAAATAAMAEAAMAKAAMTETGHAKAPAGAPAFTPVDVVTTALVETAFTETSFVETSFTETEVVETAVAEAIVAEAAPLAIAADARPAAAELIAIPAVTALNAVADPSVQTMNNALAEIMALSEEERLAMFT